MNTPYLIRKLFFYQKIGFTIIKSNYDKDISNFINSQQNSYYS